MSEIIETYNRLGSIRAAAAALGVSRSTVKRHLDAAGTVAAVAESRTVAQLKQTNKGLKDQLQLVTDQFNKLELHLKANKILEAHADEIVVPEWTVRTPHSSKVLGVPTLFLSDLHWGEVVNAAEVHGVNEYNLEIAKTRMKRCIQTTVSLLKSKLSGEYPGIILALGGDLFDGFSLPHAELLINSDDNILSTFMQLQEALIWAIKALADEFGKVFIPCVVGNHGRLFMKSQAKGAVQNNLDWLMAKQLEIYFKADKRVHLHIPDSLDCYYNVYGKTTCLTHGDQFHGGSGIAGIWSAILLGEARKRKRQQAVGRPFDTMVLGHWHQATLGKGTIVNGSMVGYDEYAYKNNFSYEPPTQALWIDHPTHGLTHWLPVYLEDKQQASKDWVTWAK